MWGKGTACLLGLAGFSTLALLVGTTVPGFTWLIVPAVVITVVVAEGARRTVARVPEFVRVLGLLSLGVAVISIATGWLNGLSDEPYSTPAYAHLGLSMYATPVSFQYVQYGTVHFENSYDVYLPLLTFIQAPGLDYRWVAVAAWAGTLWVVRRDPFTSAGLATPWVALLAANGQNDFVGLLAVSVALLAPPARGRWAVEILSLGLKQFANVLVFGYHLIRGEYLRAAAAIVVTLALLVPFLIVSPDGVWCHVLVGDPGSACMGHPWTFFVFKRNYWLYPTWITLAFHGPIRRWLVPRLPRFERNPGPEAGAARGDGGSRSSRGAENQR